MSPTPNTLWRFPSQPLRLWVVDHVLTQQGEPVDPEEWVSFELINDLGQEVVDPYLQHPIGTVDWDQQVIDNAIRPWALPFAPRRDLRQLTGSQAAMVHAIASAQRYWAEQTVPGFPEPVPDFDDVFRLRATTGLGLNDCARVMWAAATYDEAEVICRSARYDWHKTQAIRQAFPNAQAIRRLYPRPNRVDVTDPTR